MTVDVKIPEVGESVREALLAQWLKRDGETVRKDEILFVIETDKVTLEVSATADGVLKILIGEGQTVEVGTVVGSIETAAAQAMPATRKTEAEKAPPAAKTEAKPSPATRQEPTRQPPPPEPAPSPPAAAAPVQAKPLVSPSAGELAQKSGVDPSRVTATGPGGRVTEGDVLLYMEQGGSGTEARMPEEVPRPEPRAAPGTSEMRSSVPFPCPSPLPFLPCLYAEPPDTCRKNHGRGTRLLRNP
jgi:2-oxoglutarate dehydrogenase E2 component (dihydrolipoamide succinyltransferase)